MCALVTGVQTCARPICMPRSEIDAYTKFVGIYGAKGLAYIKVNDAASIPDGLQSPIVKNIHTNALTAVIERTGAQSGDLIFFGADRIKVVNDAIGALRVKIGHSEFGKKDRKSKRLNSRHQCASRMTSSA